MPERSGDGPRLHFLNGSSAMPFGSVKYTECMMPWSTTPVTSVPAASRRLRRTSSACSSGTLNDR